MELLTSVVVQGLNLSAGGNKKAVLRQAADLMEPIHEAAYDHSVAVHMYCNLGHDAMLCGPFVSKVTQCKPIEAVATHTQ